MPDYQDALKAIQALLRDPNAFRGGAPQWKSADAMHKHLTASGYRLTDAKTMGPKGLPDGQQLIYQGPSNVIVKVKTRGYDDGGPPQRVGVATMSIEATDGQGTEWKNTLFKVDSNGKVLAKSITGAKGEVVELPAGHPGLKDGLKHGVKNPRDGSIRPLTKFEVIEGGANPKPIDIQAWADAGHLNLPKDFNPQGADKLASTVAAKPPPKPPPPPAPKPPPRPTRIRGIVIGVGAAAGTLLVGILMSWLRQKLDQNILDKQIAELAPEITNWLHTRKHAIAELQAAGRPAYANVLIDVVVFRNNDRIRGPQDTIPLVDLKSVDISPQDINSSGRVLIEAKYGGLTLKYTTPFTYSFEVSLPDTVVNEWKAIQAEFDAVKPRLSDKSLTADQQREAWSRQNAAVNRMKKWLDAD